MDTLREKISSALCELVGRKDASVFQSADNFEKMLQKIGNWPQLPEILALKAGLQERVPWELQKGSSGPVSRNLINSLAANIGRKQQINLTLAIWAIESWAISLGLTIEPAALKPDAIVSSGAKPTTAKPVTEYSGQEIAETSSATEHSRIGIIFGTDASGLIRVFKSWWRPASSAETAGLAATQVYADKTTGSALFVAAPGKKKKPTGGLSQAKSASAKSIESSGSTSSVASVAPVKSSVASGQSVIPAKPGSFQAPDAVQKLVSIPPVPGIMPSVPARPVVYNGSAEELCAQAQALLPGYGTRVNIPEALEILQQAVKLGSVTARRRIGEIYHKGLGVKQDFKIAANWFRQAGESGDAASQFYMGTLYQCGMGVEFNLVLARTWLQKAADQGHKEARALLLEMLQA